MSNNYELYDISNAKIAKFIMAHNSKRRTDRDNPNIKSTACCTIVYMYNEAVFQVKRNKNPAKIL